MAQPHSYSSSSSSAPGRALPALARGLALVALLLAVSQIPAGYARSSPSADAKVCDQLTASVREGVFESLVWPKAAAIYLSGKLPAAWDANPAGELQPAGVYNGSTLVREFFFGYAGPLSTNTSQNQDQERIVDVQVIWMSCNATARIVTAETFLVFQDGYGNPIYTTDVIHVYKFSNKSRICGYSLTSKRQEIIIDSLPGFVTPALVIPTVCNAIQLLCTGNNTQYASVTACIEFMSSIDFGSSADLDQNNVLCRRQNLPMIEMNPNAYCPWVGPSGGGRCVPHGVSSQYLVKNFIACS